MIVMEVSDEVLMQANACFAGGQGVLASTPFALTPNPCDQTALVCHD